jgi:hypothetical protein
VGDLQGLKFFSSKYWVYGIKRRRILRRLQKYKLAFVGKCTEKSYLKNVTLGLFAFIHKK